MNVSDIMILRATFTVVSLCLFVGIAFWAFSRRNRADFEEAAQLPFNED